MTATAVASIDSTDTRPGEPVPPAVRAQLEPALGVDLFDVQVLRGDAAAVRSRQLGARAFTAASQVYLPASHGPVDRSPGGPLLAHELTHVAQQRSQRALPAESSPGGRTLEAEARAAESAWTKWAPTVRQPHEPASTAATAPPPSPPAAPSPAPAHVQRAPVEQEPVPPSAPQTGSPPLAPGGGDLDQLADDLFPKIRVRFLEELRDYRERSGTLVDP